MKKLLLVLLCSMLAANSIVTAANSNDHSFIVVFKAATPQSEINRAEQEIVSQGGEVRHHYNMPGFKGFAVKSSDKEAFTLMQANPYAKFVEADQEGKQNESPDWAAQVNCNGR
ncbi:uncharacterized protein VTP21DRAFT_2434 [Calcarisporiella thermophila]|uniref:uncharacterized protein n=1 Tax=Calcarisporiella thermophila TaxID=911321 RepID=UPI0037440DD0